MREAPPSSSGGMARCLDPERSERDRLVLNCRFIDAKIASMRVFYDHDTNKRLIANLRTSIAGGTRPTAMLERPRRAPADFGPLVGGFDTVQAEEAASELADLLELSASLQECALVE